MISERDLLALVEPLAFLAAFAYLCYLVVRWTAVMVNGRRPAETVEDWCEWMERDARRCACQPEDAVSNLVGWRVDAGGLLAQPSEAIIAFERCPTCTHARPRYVVTRVTEGRYSGVLVRVLIESHAEPGSWFVEVVEGTGEVRRGDRTVVRGDWLA